MGTWVLILMLGTTQMSAIEGFTSRENCEMAAGQFDSSPATKYSAARHVCLEVK